jgi:hypothetical protein
VQTFCPLLDFEASAEVLDWQRLGKQRVETVQILNALVEGTGWKNHPAVKMWSGYEGALARYGLAMVREWVARGYKDIKCGPILESYAEEFPHPCLPPWWGDEKVHVSHQSRLIQKNTAFYRHKFPEAPTDLAYVWPRLSGDWYTLE